jgi:hypothetical protein
MRLALEALGQGWRATPVPVADKAKVQFAGIYDFAGVKRVVRFEEGRLSVQREGGPEVTLVPVAKDEFVFDKAFGRLKFKTTSSGAIESVAFQSRGQPEQTGKRVADAPAARHVVSLAPGKLDRLIGDYELEPGFRFTITREGTRLFMQATGQAPAEAFATSETRFFFRVADAQIEFAIGDDGRASALTLFQGGRAMLARRVE